jgi:N6-adenosine-specific RNA methylase IME4
LYVNELTLPDPADITLPQLRAVVIPAAERVRRQLEIRGDLAGAREMCRQLEAFRKYLQDREGRDLLAAECRRTEILIGKLLGPAEEGRPRKTSPTGEVSNRVPREDRHKFRLMAAHEEQVEELLAAGQVARNTILGHLKHPGNGKAGEGCTVADLGLLIEAGRTFGTIYADPPWQYGNQATRAATHNHYRTMTVDDLANLPVKDLAADPCHLHLWTTSSFLREALDLLKYWGFTYKSMFVWVKPQLGIGNYWRVSHEILLLGVRGDLTFANKSLRSWQEYNRTEHSRKPEQIRRLVETASPGPYLELFGRRAVDGWTVWGDDIARDLFTQGIEEFSGESA